VYCFAQELTDRCAAFDELRVGGYVGPNGYDMTTFSMIFRSTVRTFIPFCSFSCRFGSAAVVPQESTDGKKSGHSGHHSCTRRTL
jgi:hypothetical protein